MPKDMTTEGPRDHGVLSLGWRTCCCLKTACWAGSVGEGSTSNRCSCHQINLSNNPRPLKPPSLNIAKCPHSHKHPHPPSISTPQISPPQMLCIFLIVFDSSTLKTILITNPIYASHNDLNSSSNSFSLQHSSDSNSSLLTSLYT